MLLSWQIPSQFFDSRHPLTRRKLGLVLKSVFSLQVVASPLKCKLAKRDNDDDEDLEMLRMAALRSLRTKDAPKKKSSSPLKQGLRAKQQSPKQQSTKQQAPFVHNQSTKSGNFANRLAQRQNGVCIVDYASVLLLP